MPAFDNTTRLANPAVLVNNKAILIVPNSFKYTEGFGEQKVEPQSGGGGYIQNVYGKDVSTALSMCSFTVANTEQNIEDAKQWKLNENSNTIIVTCNDFTRTFTFACLINNYEVGMGSDTNIDLEWTCNPAV